MLTETHFKQYLALYGAQLETWPPHLRAEAMQAMDNLASNNLAKNNLAKNNLVFAALVSEQRALDALLSRRYDVAPARDYLADRIIARMRVTKQQAGFGVSAWLRELLLSIFPHPAVALASIVALGFTIGLNIPAALDEPLAFASYADEGAVL